MHAVLATCPDAIETGRRLDAELRQGKSRGTLHGIPVLVKDNIDTAGDEGTTAGSLALAMTRPTNDAVVVQRLRSAGAIATRESNLSEWANFRELTPPAAGVPSAVSAATLTRWTARREALARDRVPVWLPDWPRSQ